MSMTDIATLRFDIDTRPLLDTDAAAEKVIKRFADLDAITAKMSANVTAAFAKVPAAMSGIQAASAGATQAAGGSATQIQAAAKQMDDLAKQADALRAKIDPLAAAHLKMSDSIGSYARMAASGLISQKELTAGIGLAESAFKKAEEEIRKHTSALKLNGNQVAELQHVGKALFDEWMAGGSILRGVGMEAGRLADIFGPGLKNSLMGISGVTGIAAGGMAAFGVAATAAAVAYENSQARLQRAVEGTGRASGLTAIQLGGIADTGARAGNMGYGEARGIATGYAQAGLPSDMISSLTAATPRYSRFTDQDNTAGGAKLADDFRDPVAGVKDLDKTFGFLNDRLLGTIEDLKASGDLEGARRVELDAFSAALKQTTDSTWAAGDAFREMKRWGGSLWEGLGHGVNHVLGGDDAPQDQLKHYRDMLPNTFDSPLAVGNLSRSYVQAQIDRLQHQIDTKVDPEAAQRTSQANELTLQARGVIGRLNPDAARYRDLENQRSLLGRVLANPDAVRDTAPGVDSSGKLVSGGDLLADTLAKVNDKLANFMGSTERQTLAINAQVQTINAWTLGEKLAAATATEMASLGVRQIRTSEELLAVQSKQAGIIAEANDRAYNLNRDAGQSLALAGLFGLDRERASIRQKAGDFRDQLTDLSGGRDLEGIGPTFLTGKTAVTGFSDALDQATRRLASFPGGAAAPATSDPAVSPDEHPLTIHRRAIVTPAMMTTMQAYIDRGFSPAAAAGFVGGLTNESGVNLDPIAKNASGHIGMAQWDPTRWNQVSRFAGGAAWTREGQTAASLAELNGPERRAGRMLASSDSVLGGVLANDAYERPGDAEAARRRPIALARGNALLDTYQGGAGAAATTGVLGVKLDTAGNINGWEQKSLAAANINAGEGILHSASDSMTQRVQAYNVLADGVGKTTSQLARYNEVMTLQNALDRAKVEITPKMRSEMTALGDQAAAQAEREERDKNRIGTEDTIRSGFSSSADTLFSGLAQGKSSRSLFKSIGFNLGESLIHSGVGTITGGLFGKQGQAGGGLFGGFLNNLISGLPHFAAGTDDAPGGLSVVGEKGPELVRMPAHAQVVSNGALNALRPAAGHTFNVGGPTINIAGDVSEQNRAEIQRAVAQGNQQVVEHITRNLGQIQADAAQTA